MLPWRRHHATGAVTELRSIHTQSIAQLSLTIMLASPWRSDTSDGHESRASLVIDFWSFITFLTRGNLCLLGASAPSKSRRIGELPRYDVNLP